MTTPIDGGLPASPAPELAWQAARALVIFACGAAASQLFHSELVAGAAMAAGTAGAAAMPAVAAWAFGALKTLRWHHQRRDLTQSLAEARRETDKTQGMGA
jgi:hypothetical protein